MAEDLAIDVGIPIDTDEYDSFVACVNNLLEYGCSYSSAATDKICERCEKSELPIAKEVLRECRRTRTSGNTRTSGYRKRTKQEWWQTWRSKRTSDVPQWSGTRAEPPEHRKKRPMSPMFHENSVVNRQRRSPPRTNRQRRSPPRANRQKRSSPRANRQKRSSPRANRQKRPMSPMFEKRVHREPENTKRRRRYR